MSTPKLFAPQFLQSNNSLESQIYLWITNLRAVAPYPYAVTSRPLPIRINKAFSPMAHYTRITNGKCILLTSVPTFDYAVVAAKFSNVLSTLGFPSHDSLGQLIVPAPIYPNQLQIKLTEGYEYQTPIKEDIDGFRSLIAGRLELIVPEPHILQEISHRVESRDKLTKANTERVKRYRDKEKSNPYFLP